MIVTASKARANLYRLIDETTLNHQPVVISGKRHNAVLVSLRRGLGIASGNNHPFIRPRHERVTMRRLGDFARRMQQGGGLVSWQLVYTKHAQKDAQKLAAISNGSYAASNVEAVGRALAR